MALQVYAMIMVQDLEAIERARVTQRILRDNSNPFEYSNTAFKKMFRVGKPCAQYIIEALRPHIPEQQRDTFIANELKVLAALSFYGKGSYQLDVGQNHLFGLSQPSMSRCFEIVTSANNNHFIDRWIKFPTTVERKNLVKVGFYEKYQLRNVIGAIYCTHVAIVAPKANDPIMPGRLYFNRKGYTSINVQIICDSNLRILSINARFPGSTHDSAIWATSAIRTHLQSKYVHNNEEGFLLGDSGYPLEPWLLTPVDGALPGTPESQFNRQHILSRNCIERVNGVIKARFRCLLRHRTLHYNPIKSAQIIYACAALHNIAIQFHDAHLEEEEEEFENVPPVAPFPNLQNNWLQEGRRVRQQIIQNL